MGACKGVVFVLDPRCGPGLAAQFHAHGMVRVPSGCALELFADRHQHPRELQAVVSWDHAVPLKVQRLAQALLAAGAVLRRDLDADGLRHRALAAGRPAEHIAGLADMVAFAVRTAPPAAPPAERHLVVLSSAA